MRRTTCALIALSTILPHLLSASVATAAAAAKVEILSPVAGQVLQGNVTVRVKITPPEGLSDRFPAYVGIGGTSWTQLKRVAESHEWTGRIDTTLFPNGVHRLMVATSDKRAKASVAVKLQNPLKVFFGNLHSHTAYSDGTLTLAVAHQYARDEAKLDVFSLTDHLEQVDEQEWIAASNLNCTARR